MLRTATLATLLAIVPLASNAGTTGTITGTVIGEPNTPVAGARVTAISDAQVVTTLSDAHGRFVFISLGPGRYEVRAEHAKWLDGAVLVQVVADHTTIADPHLLATVAMVTLDGPFTFYGLGMGIGAGRVADVYTYSIFRTMDRARPDADLQDIRFTPGVVTMPGNAVMH